MDDDLVGALGLLERAIGYTRVALHGLGEHELAAPTPCARWDLRALLAHMTDSLAALREAGESGRVHAVQAPRPISDPAATLRTQACELLARWVAHRGRVVAIAGSRLGARALVSTGALEIAVHGWDVAVARRVPHPLPPHLAAALLAVVPAVVADADRPARFGAPLPVDDTAPADQRLLAALGRDPAGDVPAR